MTPKATRRHSNKSSPADPVTTGRRESPSSKMGMSSSFTALGAAATSTNRDRYPAQTHSTQIAIMTVPAANWTPEASNIDLSVAQVALSAPMT